MLSSTALVGVMVSLTSINTVYSINLCSNEYTGDVSYYTKNLTIQNCGCLSCLRRCCQPGFNLKKGYCHRHFGEQFSVQLFADKTFVKSVSDIENFEIGIPDCKLFRVKSSEFYFQLNGSVLIPLYNTTFDNNLYCIDEGAGLSVLLCLPSNKTSDLPKSKLFKFTSLGMIISMPFLLCTFLVYAILPESNIHRKALMCYVLSLLIGYGCLVYIQLNTEFIASFWCHSLGYSITFFFISSFFWMNVMCVDMWLAFSGLRGFKGKRSTELKRFLAYFAYALGMPLLLVIIIFLLNTFADEKSIFNPKLGETRCFLEEGYPNLFYFYLPMAIIIGINIILFILTAVRIQRVKKETSMLKHSDSKRHSYEEEKQQFNLYLKLLFAMGINWSMEVISWAVGWRMKSVPNYIWYLTDFTNAAYGVFIFLIFVFKRKIKISLQKRYYNFINKPHLAHTLSTSHPARTSNYSTTDTAVSHDYRLSEMKNGRGEERPLSRN